MIGWWSKLCSKPPLLNTLHKQIHITHHHGTYVGPPFTQAYTKQTNKQRPTHCKWTRRLIDWSRVVCSDPSPPEPCWHPSMGPISPLQLPCQPHRDEGGGGGGGEGGEWLKERGTSCPGNEDPQALPFIGTAPSVYISTLLHIITKFEFANVKVLNAKDLPEKNPPSLFVNKRLRSGEDSRKSMLAYWACTPCILAAWLHTAQFSSLWIE